MNNDDLEPARRDDILASLIIQDIDPLSVDELQNRIVTLKAEIDRCEVRLVFASRHRSVADSLFRK
jgi:uncharacterized small protein (DUF1192 family)